MAPLLIVDSIQSDISALKTEAGKKYPKVREASERADRHLRDVADGIESATDALIASALRESDEMLAPCLAAIETRQSRLLQCGAAYLARLASHDAVRPAGLPAVGRALRQGGEGGDEQVQLRVLQAIMGVMQAPSLSGEGGTALLMLETLLVLYSSRN
eukprot:CAMPEP_0174925286 /NCGR_PEP_ID=MMETSP1355-20121228/7811_1 /TAXON_ID=464990 /ORGANISM="Hemiselmis tepida, Strain CCMP443" /LENGTH=158 /DNA_ID=CAMNT_0016171179 /DNA_START=116 /DNA_END=589 /DNA_ORIENTATION=-